jgi:hypothetical protein
MTEQGNNNNGDGSLESFPSITTILVGVWLLVFSALSVFGLYWAFLLISPNGVNSESFRQIQESLVTLFAAGVGSSITTILGYLMHASVKKDFDSSYTPWYFARPVMGMLLGLVFYFVIKGGLFVLTVESSTAGVEEMNLWSLSATGALVGLFSKNAIEKLRELFNTLFRTQDKMNRELMSRLPKELRAQVSPYLGGEAKQPEQPPKKEKDKNKNKKPEVKTKNK